MKARRGTVIDVDSLAEFNQRIEAGARSLDGWRLQVLDLRGRTEDLRGLHLAGATFLGCTFDEGSEQAARDAGAIVFPTMPTSPIEPFRASLYTPHELYAGLTEGGAYEATRDARTYAWSRTPETPETSLAKSLHDHGIDGALTEWKAARRFVGVMGGHGLVRGSSEYARAAQLGHLLAAHQTVATGGGPGAMEAANLGAAVREQSHLQDALKRLSTVPSFRPRVEEWVRAALDVLADVPSPRASLGIPTWFYGHEPPNPFATSIAKYFRNAQREAILLQMCDAGIIFLPGAGGTVQEIFQDACENYYADESLVAPMVLLGRRYWTEQLPAWPLLQALARGRPMEQHIHLVDSAQEAADLVHRDL